jgi:hypothetical protein
MAGANDIITAPEGKFLERGRADGKGASEKPGRDVLEASDGGEPQAAQAFLGDGPDAGKLAHGQRRCACAIGMAVRTPQARTS